MGSDAFSVVSPRFRAHGRQLLCAADEKPRETPRKPAIGEIGDIIGKTGRIQLAS